MGQETVKKTPLFELLIVRNLELPPTSCQLIKAELVLVTQREEILIERKACTHGCENGGRGGAAS